MSEKVKRIDVKEFRNLGYLQELNRRFLHPLGLALEVIVNKETGEETLGGVWDYREEAEGIYYAANDSAYTPEERLKELRRKKKFIDEQWEKKASQREKELGFVIEPIP